MTKHTYIAKNDFVIMECKECGMQLQMLKSQRSYMKKRCRRCGCQRFRTVQVSGGKKE